MKLFFSMIIIVICSACTTLTPVEFAPGQLHERISTDKIIQVGNNVKIVTSDGKQHIFIIKTITQDSIQGNDFDTQEMISIPIKDIVSIDLREATVLTKIGVYSAVLVGTFLFWEFISQLFEPTWSFY